MNYKETLDKLSNDIQWLIYQLADGVKIETEDFGWDNRRYASNRFRMAHIERYSDSNLEVLHFTCFPTKYSQLPIFGCDIITTDKKPLAAFMDWSPVDSALEMTMTHQFEKPYPLPDWAKIIFSPTALAIVPSDNEMEKLTEVILQSFKTYISLLGSSKDKSERIDYIIAAQNRYCENQQKNERTYNVLKAKLGKERAKYFMETILFPKID
jgi:phycocyanobilin:ferredoxin oxidoreductase